MNVISTILSPVNEIADQLGANNLPYSIPIHPNLVHFTIGLFAIGIAFDFAGAFYPLEKRVFRFLALPATRSGFHDVGWYNVLACSVITFPLPGIRSIIGQTAIDTMLWHAIGGVALLLIIVVMTIWRGFQRFLWRKDYGRQVSWLYLGCGAVVLLAMGVHGSLGAWLASEFGVHITADQLLASGTDLRQVLP
jgi:uncharacterized membrane protein